MNTHIYKLLLILVLFVGGQFLSADESEAEKTIQGYFIEQPDNTYLHVEMVGIRMVFKLLDEGYREIENVYTRGVMTVNPKGGSGIRMVIRPTGDGFSLQSSRTIRKPHLLKIIGRLFKGEDDETGVAFNLNYNQHRLKEATVVPEPEE